MVREPALDSVNSTAGPIAGRRLEVLVAGLLAIACVLYFRSYIRAYSQYPTDDAFIHLRIARNFVEHGRPYYNPEQAVSGSSSFLWTLLLSALFAGFGVRLDILPDLELVLAAALFALCAAILSRRFSPLLSVALAFFFVATFGLNVAAEFMETPCALVFFLAAVLAFQRERFVWVGLFSALAFLTRYECVVWLGLAFLLAPGFGARRRLAAGAAAPLLAYVVFNYSFFGGLIPNAVFAKSRVYQITLGEFFSALEMSWREIVLFVAAAALLAQAAFRRETPAWAKAVAVFPLILFSLYAAARTLLFEWYLPLVFLPLMLSCALIVPRRRLYALALVLVAIRPLPIAAAREAYGVLLGDATRYREYAMGARVRQYVYIGAELGTLFPGAVLMASEIGGLGWTFRGKIIDAGGGLISPECLKYHPLKIPEDRANGTLSAIPPQAVRDLSPQLIVSMETFSQAVRRDLASGRLNGYRLLYNYPVIDEAVSARSGIVALWGSRFTQVYIREDAFRP